MTYLIIAILLLTIILSYYIDDISKFFKLSSIITIISGYLVIIIVVIGKTILKKKITFINISKITAIISRKGINRGLILILLGAIELIIYVSFVFSHRRKKRRIKI